MIATTSTLNVASDWLIQMGDAAAAIGVPLQYCMALPRSALMSLLVPAVSQVLTYTIYRQVTKVQVHILPAKNGRLKNPKTSKQ